MITTSLTTVDAEAHTRALRGTVAELTAWLQELLGQRLTAAIVGVRSPKVIGAWARGESTPHPAAERRLREAYRIAWLLRQADAPVTVRAWFVGMNPQLDDEAPGEVIARDPLRVLQAARAFLAGG